MDVRYLILSLFFLVSCMPTATVSNGNLSSTETTGGTTSGSSGTAPATNLSWNYLGQLTTSITINVSNLNTSYVVGTPVETFLSQDTNFTSANYCLISSFSIGGITHELRSRVVPISYYDFKARRNVRVMRVDFQDVRPKTDDHCFRTSRIKNSSDTFINDPSTPSVSRIQNDPKQICPLCSNMLIAVRTRLFKVETTTVDEVPLTAINTGTLSLQVDPNYNIVGDAGTCTNSICRARGFDCCLENQCVRDGGEKPAARTTYASLFQTAEQEKLQNPLAYLNYPQLYYICGSSVPTTGGSSGGTTTGGSTGGYDSAFEQLKKDFKCIEHIKSQATVSPFHNEVLSKTYTGKTDCLTLPTESSETFYFQNVMKRLYTTCGCNRTNLSDMITNCPKYDYTVVSRDTLGEPVRIDCYTPPVDSGTIPQDQTVSVSSRAAPHRFFDSTGTEKSVPAGEQEGDLFEYMDEGKVLPVQKDFSMNAILGQMSVTLDKALPAKEVKVELDQVYIISTTSGFYTPCPSCAKDSWLNAFTAFPSSSSGVGLQAIGHTTERDTFSTNTTAGNYEDTIFGRACWLPPTMIPFSHSARSSVQSQRLNRLQTQAALFVNGYQRDWFGFNKGALIGSFDGVSWFAVGKGRIVRSTSKKLYLAINAPFADLAAPTMHVVRVSAYDGITQAAQVDYDPQYHQSHPYQNEAGNCQKFHMCNTDTDCITRLGWEYACADVKDLRTNWPSFDSNASEQAEISTSVTIDQILQQKRLVSSSAKRCVYRGAGAVCHSNSQMITSDLNKRKALTCAPNFFCANVSTSGVHNSKVARYAAILEEIPVARNHFFGKDANILGRPHDYTGNASLGSVIRSTLIENLTPYESTLSNNTGLCQPGKGVPTPTNQGSMSNPFNQHMFPDATRRTDFISQIGSCNSGLFTENRHSSCPVIGTDGNYYMFSQLTLPTNYSATATNQNACGLESLLPTASLASTPDQLQSSSPFRSIEARPLNSQIIVDPTLVRDACYRRAGTVCHTDLDCSPNKMHATQVDFFNSSFFGNSAEKTYWSEYLVCGQTAPKPMPSDTEAFKNYDMSRNRCCREIGKDLTTHTSDIPLSTAGGNYDANTRSLKMSINPALIPNDPKRYSRLATVDNIGVLSTKPVLSAFQDRTGVGTVATNTAYTLGTNVKSAHQWKTLTEANSENCCGGGWIRKFSDGSNDWTRRDRLVLDVQNFRCINSRSILLSHPEDVASQFDNAAHIAALISQDYGDYCTDSTNTRGSCAQYSMLDNRHDVLPASDPYLSVTVNTIKPDYNRLNNGDYYFTPRSADNNSAVILDLNDTSVTARRHISLKVPSYIPSRLFDDLISTRNIRMELENGTGLTCEYDPNYNPLVPTDGLATAFCSSGVNCCFYNLVKPTPNSRILKVGLNVWATSSVVFDKKKVGVRFVVPVAGNGVAGLTRTKPGSTAYYLKRLGLLELSGIPQITFEALTCNDNSNRIVPGIFSPAIKFLNSASPASSFSSTNFSFRHSYSGKTDTGQNSSTVTGLFTNQYGLAHEPVFSANDFKCCSPLGRTVTDASKCCSGYGVDIGNNGTMKTCALPDGTNLMVYFNRFVSNEGRGAEQPGGGLTEADFDDETGETKREASVVDKVRSLGQAYCASGSVRQGGAFGSYEPEPQGTETNLAGRIYNIVDSPRDYGQSANAGQTVNSGYTAFMDGFRWNHHLYCDDGG